MVTELYHDLTSCWLDSVALATMRACIEQTLQIPSLTSTGLKQLLMDLRECDTEPCTHPCLMRNASACSGYLYSVLEDFGLKDVGDFRDLTELLDADEEQFEEMSRHKPARMVTTIRAMRHL